MSRPSTEPLRGLAADVAEISAVAVRDRWGLGLVAVGWTHLLVFALCQLLFSRGDRAESHFLPLWGLDLALAVAIFRRFVGGTTRKRGPVLLQLGIRIWVTFLILTFSAASLNRLMGFEADWFKAVWGTLSTFGFAMMAWVFHLRFLIPAVQMSITAMLIVRFPSVAYLIYGASWCLALSGIGLTLERRRLLVGLGRRMRPSPVHSCSTTHA